MTKLAVLLLLLSAACDNRALGLSNTVPDLGGDNVFDFAQSASDLSHSFPDLNAVFVDAGGGSLSCGDILVCASSCATLVCADECAASGSAAAQQLFSSLLACATEVCISEGECVSLSDASPACAACVGQQGAADPKCSMIISACISQQ